MNGLVELTLLNIERSIETIMDETTLTPEEAECLGLAYGKIMYVRRKRKQRRVEADDAEMIQ